jgi:hypothetical protein
MSKLQIRNLRTGYDKVDVLRQARSRASSAPTAQAKAR